ncbi:MAG: alkaline phosphatase family protein [Planctomycetota bacterium]
MSPRHVLALALVTAALVGCGGDEPKPHFPGVFAIGFDGMEPTIVEAEMKAGRMPNFSRLAEQGGYCRLGTSLPPESPVAWADFITGNDSGVHGIFDFIHHEITPRGIRLYYGAAMPHPPERYWWFFGYRIPSPFGSPGGTELRVRGKFFWEYLTERSIPASVVRVPSNYPPKEVGARTFSGMGTPDVQGTYGTFSYYTDDPPLDADDMPADVVALELEGGVARTVLRGPQNTYEYPRGPRRRLPYSTVPLVIYVDADRRLARVDVGEETRILAEGEWSDWIPVNFPLIPGLASASGIVRLYLQETSPHVKLYASPVNIDPVSPDLAISTPPEAAAELAQAIGRYYTQGMAEETQANRYEVLDTAEFLAQAELVLEERRRMLDHEVERFKRLGGLTFFYFSTTDLCAHMVYRYMDEGHPLYTEDGAAKYGRTVREIYHEMDRLLGKVMDAVPEGTRIVVLSDHGFRPYRRQLSVNTWLLKNRYLELRYPERQGRMAGYRNVDWYGTRAYGVGFTGICLNLEGREPNGAVLPQEAEDLKREIIEKLEALVDPETGQRVVTKVYRREDVYHGPETENAPDLIIGFAEHYGCSDASIKGGVPRKMFKDTDDSWSGSHMVDPSHVPGILLVNTKLKRDDPKLYDLAPSILGDFGIEPEGMRGRPVW